MPARVHVAAGLLLGCCVTAAILTLVDADGGSSQREFEGTLVSDCDGSLQHLVMHFVPQAADVVLPTYREFLTQLPSDVTVHVVCPDRTAFDSLVASIGPCECSISPIEVRHPITTWSRDRWLALAGEQESTRLLAPNDERAAGVWPERQGDRQVAEDIAAALGSGVTARRSPLFFDGGDFVADAETVFVTPSVLFRNLQLTVYSSDELRDVLHTRTERQVVLLETAPDHHAGMFMMPVGERTVLVGDPSAAWEILDRRQAGAVPRPDLLPEGIHPDRSPETQRRFDAVADQCQAQGYRVVRMPLVPGDDGRTWLSYLNVILDERSGQRTVYLPVFDGAEELNKAAIAAWEKLGFLVRPVNCTACAAHFGTLRCLVNVLRRS